MRTRADDVWLERLWGIFEGAEKQGKLNEFMAAMVSFIAARIADLPTEQRGKVLAVIGEAVVEHDRLNQQEALQ